MKIKFNTIEKTFIAVLLAYLVFVAVILLLIILLASDRWATAVTSIATITLAFAAFWTILQNYKFRDKDRDIRRTNQRINKIQEWILEICSIASSCSPPGDAQERRNRIWRVEKVLFLSNSIIVETKKLNSKFSLENKLENIVISLTQIVDEQKSNPEALAAGDKTGGKGEKIPEQIKRIANEAFVILSDISDKL